MQGETCAGYDSAVTINGGEAINFSGESCSFSGDCFNTHIMTIYTYGDFQTQSLASHIQVSNIIANTNEKKTSIEWEK